MATNDDNINRGRRVTDQHGGLLDLAHQAVQIANLEKEQSVLAERVSQRLDANKSALENVQHELRSLGSRIEGFGRLQSSHESNKESIENMRESLGDLNRRLEDWFNDHDLRQERKWREFEQNRDEWRAHHEAENEDDIREANKRIDNVREKIIWAIGYVAGAGLLSGLVLGGFVYFLNYRFQETKDEVAGAKQTMADDRRRLDDLADKHGDKLHEIELYLARGGRVPEQPYITDQQKGK